MFAPEDLSENAFLGGQITLLQPQKGYRAGVDPVLLAASVAAKAGQRVLELGCGAGQALICLGARIPSLHLTGVELQPEYADLARRNGALNGMNLHIETADLKNLSADMRQQTFDHILANPPYFRAGAHSAAQDAGRQRALGEQTPLADWVDVATRRLTPKGFFYMIQRADRLMDVLQAIDTRLGSVEVRPIAPRVARAAELVLIRARKSGRAGFRLHAPLIMHTGQMHDADRPDYTDAVDAVLRHGAALSWPE